MKKRFVLMFALALAAAACQKVELKTERPSSPPASYEVLPR